MDLQIPACWILRLAAMLTGLSLLCSNTSALPVVVTGSPEPPTAYNQNLVQDNTSAGATGSLTSDIGRQQRLKKRLLSVAAWGGAILMLLAVAYGYFRLELTTRGFYSGRLQITSSIVSLAILIATYFFWRWLISN